ncbi:MAG: AAA family ATPase, partial [bacterium]|nr:AAA family ATPase [bacterium]
MMTVLETKSTENPFVYNAPVRGTDFSNRKKTIEKLMKEVVSGKSRGNVWITGERQVGKTSLLRYMQSEYEKYPGKIKLYPLPDLFSVSFIYLNVQDTESRENFYRILRQSLKNHFDFKLETKEDPFESFIEALKYLFNERKNYIVFLVDEFDAFIENLAGYDKKRATAFLAELNKLIQGVEHIKNDPKAFSCIFAANHTINELMKVNEISRRGSGLVVESMELEWFTPEQMEDLARDYLKNNAVEFSKEDLDFCFKMTQGYP